MLFMRTAPRRPSLSSSDAVNSVSARAFAISRRPFGVGQQNRVGDGVDDAVEQRAFAALLAVALREGLLPQDLIDLLREHGRKPVHVRRQRRAAGEQQETERVLGKSGHAERQAWKPRLRMGSPAAAASARSGRRAWTRGGLFSVVTSGLLSLERDRETTWCLRGNRRRDGESACHHRAGQTDGLRTPKPSPSHCSA
jgi:hypothetical protein